MSLESLKSRPAVFFHFNIHKIIDDVKYSWSAYHAFDASRKKAPCQNWKSIVSESVSTVDIDHWVLDSILRFTGRCRGDSFKVVNHPFYPSFYDIFLCVFIDYLTYEEVEFSITTDEFYHSLMAHRNTIVIDIKEWFYGQYREYLEDINRRLELHGRHAKMLKK